MLKLQLGSKTSTNVTSGSEALPRKSSGNEDRDERKWKLFNTINEDINTYSGQSDMIQIVLQQSTKD